MINNSKIPVEIRLMYYIQLYRDKTIKDIEVMSKYNDISLECIRRGMSSAYESVTKILWEQILTGEFDTKFSMFQMPATAKLRYY